MITSNELSSRGAKDLLPFMVEHKNLDVKKAAEEKGLLQKSDPTVLKTIVTEVIAENPTQVADYKSGKESMFMYFVGQCMKKSKGAGNQLRTTYANLHLKLMRKLFVNSLNLLFIFLLKQAQ
jgi:aspartyl-tRNA(Asn)/glutamyl-tRNA(Gln) amidotransferase subunit B